MISVFEFDNYRKFMVERFAQMPHKGYGQMSELARFLGVHTTLISQILKEHKQLSTDQAAVTADFFQMNEMESEYFVLLVQLDRAGNTAAKNIIKKQILRLKEQSQSISKRVKVDARLSEEQRAVFYSDWAYTAVRQTAALPGLKDVDAIADFLHLPRKRVHAMTDFLLQSGLLKMQGQQLSVGPASTHVEASSPWARVHHGNWRGRAIHALDSGHHDHLHYTLPLTISAKDAERVREKILQFIEQVNDIVDPSPSEKLYGLNIDWFDVSK